MSELFVLLCGGETGLAEDYALYLKLGMQQ